MKRFLTALAATTMLASAAFAAGPADHPGPRHGFGGHHKALNDILTPEQKAKLDAARDQLRKTHDEVIASLTPEQKEKLDAARKPFQERAEKRRAALESVLTPEQKAELDKARGGKTRDQLTDAERDSVRAAFKKVLDSLTPEQKEKLRALHKEGRGRG